MRTGTSRCIQVQLINKPRQQNCSMQNVPGWNWVATSVVSQRLTSWGSVVKMARTHYDLFRTWKLKSWTSDLTWDLSLDVRMTCSHLWLYEHLCFTGCEMLWTSYNINKPAVSEMLRSHFCSKVLNIKKNHKQNKNSFKDGMNRRLAWFFQFKGCLGCSDRSRRL